MTAPTTPSRAGQARVSDKYLQQACENADALVSVGYELMIHERTCLDLRDERAETARLRAKLATANARADKAERERDQSKAQHADCERLACATAETLGTRITRADARIAKLEKAGTREQGLREAALIASGFDAASNSKRNAVFQKHGLMGEVCKRDIAIADAILSALDTPTEGGGG